MLIDYGVDMDKLYPDNDLLNYDYIDSMHYTRDPVFIAHKARFSAMSIKAVKTKKLNDYARSKEKEERYIKREYGTLKKIY